MTKLNKKEILSIIISIVCIVLGILFCVLPQTMYEKIEIIICFALILYGGLSVFIYCLTPVIFESPLRMFSALVSLILGILIMFIKSFLVIAIAILMLLLGGIKIYTYIKERKISQNNNKFDFVSGIVFCVLGFVVGGLCYTPIGTRFLMLVLGIIIFIEAVSNLIFVFYKKKQKKVV